MSFCHRHSNSPVPFRSLIGSGQSGDPNRIKSTAPYTSPANNNQRFQSSASQGVAGNNSSSTGKHRMPAASSIAHGSFTSPFVNGSQVHDFTGFSPVRNSQAHFQSHSRLSAAAAAAGATGSIQKPQNASNTYFQPYVSSEGISARPEEVDQLKLRHEIEAREHELKLLAQMDYLIDLIKDLDQELEKNPLDKTNTAELEKLKSSYANLQDELEQSTGKKLDNPNEIIASNKTPSALAASIRESLQEQPFQQNIEITSSIRGEQLQQQQPIAANILQSVNLSESQVSNPNLNSQSLNPAFSQPTSQAEQALLRASIQQSKQLLESKKQQQQSQLESSQATNPHQQQQQTLLASQQLQQLLSSQSKNPNSLQASVNNNVQLTQAREAALREELKIKDQAIENLQSELISEIRERESSVASANAARREAAELVANSQLPISELEAQNQLLLQEIDRLQNDNNSLVDRVLRLESNILASDKERETSSKAVLDLLQAKDLAIQRFEQQQVEDAQLIQHQQSQLQIFSNYVNPQEVNQIEQALLQKSGEYEELLEISKSLQRTIVSKDGVIDSLQLSFELQTESLREAKASIEDLKNQLEIALQILPAKDAELEQLRNQLTQQNEDSNQEIQRIAAILETQLNQLNNLQEDNENLTQEKISQANLIDLLKNQLAEITAQSEAQSAELQDLSQKSQQFAETIDNLTADLGAKDETIQELSRECQKLEQESARKEEEIAGLQRTFNEAIEDEAIKAEFTKEMSFALAISNAQNEETISQLQGYVAIMKEEHSKLENRNAIESAEKDDQITALEEEQAILKSEDARKGRDLETANSLLSEQQVRLQEADEKYMQYEQAIQTLEKQQGELEQANAGLREELDFMNSEISELKQKIVENDLRQEEVGQENETLKQRLIESEEIQDQQRQLNEEALKSIKELEQQVEAKNEELLAAVAEKDYVKAEYQEVAQNLANMENAIVAMQDQLEAQRVTGENNHQNSRQISESQIKQSISDLKHELSIADRMTPMYESHRSHSHQSLAGSQRFNSIAQPSAKVGENSAIQEEEDQQQQQQQEDGDRLQSNIHGGEDEEDCSNCNLCLLEEMTRQNELLKQQLLFKESELIELRTTFPNSAQGRSQHFNQSMLHRSPISGGKGQIYVEANDSIMQNRILNSFYDSPTRQQHQQPHYQQLNPQLQPQAFTINGSFASPAHPYSQSQQQQSRSSLSGSKTLQSMPPQQIQQNQNVQQYQTYSALQNEIDHLQKIFESKCKQVDSWKKVYNQLNNDNN